MPKNATLRICKACGAVDFEGLWVKASESEETFFENLLIKRIKVPENTELEGVRIVEKENTSAKVSVTVSMAGQPFTQIFPIHLETKRTICQECSMHRREQYVAVIQLRDIPANVEKMMRMASKFKTYILKFEELRTGVDIYFTSKEAGKHLASEFRRRFKLKTTLSSEAYSWDKQRNRPKYKLTMLMRARE